MTALRNLFLTRTQLALLLLAVLALHGVETQWEERFKGPEDYALGYRIAQAFHEIEGGVSFAGVEEMNRFVVGGFAFAYFFAFPALLVGTVIGCWRRKLVRELRVFSFAVVINYLVVLPFFLFVPVPERWAFPGARAPLVSDFLSPHLIALVRPISGLDNCFPSLPVALSTQVILIAYWSRSRWRHSVACLGGAVILSSFFLGIHWLPGVAAGLATAGLGFALAVRLNRAWYQDERPPPEATSRPPWRSRPPFSAVRAETNKLVFISYRRDGGSGLARVVQMELERRGYPCFLDVDDLGAEHFDERLLLEIERAPNFVLVLAPGSLDRCGLPDDWMRREILHALRHGRNIVPLVSQGFQFPRAGELPTELESLQRLNAVVYSHEYFNASFDRLEEFLNTDPG